MKLNSLVFTALLLAVPAGAADVGSVVVPPSAVTATPPLDSPPAKPKPVVVTADKEQKTPWSGEKIVCTREAPVGSLIAVRHCTTKSQDLQNRRDAEAVLERPLYTGSRN